MKKVISIILLFVITSSFTLSKRVEALIVKEIKTVFKIDNFTKEVIAVSNEINEKLPVKITDKNLFKLKNNNEVIGYYYLGKAFGKMDYFDFIVIFDDNLIVSKVKILVYREDHGGEVGSKRWLKQFIGKTTGTTLMYQKDIAAISGATISAKSMTHEVNKILQAIEVLNTNKLL